jgi:hypothetical protein
MNKWAVTPRGYAPRFGVGVLPNHNPRDDAEPIKPQTRKKT